MADELITPKPRPHEPALPIEKIAECSKIGIPNGINCLRIGIPPGIHLSRVSVPHPR